VHHALADGEVDVGIHPVVDRVEERRLCADHQEQGGQSQTQRENPSIPALIRFDFHKLHSPHTRIDTKAWNNYRHYIGSNGLWQCGALCFSPPPDVPGARVMPVKRLHFFN
jgi:hypothetical protein